MEWIQYKQEDGSYCVGGSLYLRGTAIPNLVIGGNSNRTIAVWNDKKRGWTISLGCWSGNLKDTEDRIRDNYNENGAELYISKVREACKNAGYDVE